MQLPIEHSAKDSNPIDGIKYIYTQLGYAPDGFKDPSTNPYNVGSLNKFDQKEFVQDGWTFDETTLGDFGYVYVPEACQTKSCNLHFAFHGCNASVINFAYNLGYNEFAAANDIIMIYPDSSCWGGSDLEDDNSLNRDGMLSKTIMSMVDRVTSSSP